MATEVNWDRLEKAVSWYTHISHYEYLEVPWIVSDPPYNGTRPPGSPPYATIGGNLVASGEQSFMELLLRGTTITRAVCCTPCFRAEPKFDELHLPYFMKVELIDTAANTTTLERVISDASVFFDNVCGLSTTVEDMGDGTYDIVGKNTGIELGSYGIRNWKGFSWVYGTGLAEPRTSQVISMENC